VPRLNEGGSVRFPNRLLTSSFYVPKHCIFLLLAAGLSLGLGYPVPKADAVPWIDLGPVDQFTFSQPIVQVEVSNGSHVFDLFPDNGCLLDTGASGILMGATASDSLTQDGLQTVATYVDFGVAGPENTRVSSPYTFSYAGIAGMPAMVNRTVSFDLTQQANPTALAIDVSFGSAPLTALPHQYSVPLTMFTFPITGQLNDTDPLPISAPLPFAPVKVEYGQQSKEGSFLLDT